MVDRDQELGRSMHVGGDVRKAKPDPTKPVEGRTGRRTPPRPDVFTVFIGYTTIDTDQIRNLGAIVNHAFRNIASN
jgi:hypothetical protein